MNPHDERTIHLAKTDPLLGKLLAERYEVLAPIGEGGMSVVYKVRQQTLDKVMAIKMLHSHLVKNADSLLRFQQEARAASRLDHPNAISIYDFGVTTEGQPFIAMDYLSG